MKVTALMPDSLIREVAAYAKGKNLTESLLTALREWLAFKKISRLGRRVKTRPLQFRSGFNAEGIRSLNRQSPS